MTNRQQSAEQHSECNVMDLPSECALIWLTLRRIRAARWMQQSRKPTDDWIKIKYFCSQTLSIDRDRMQFHSIYLIRITSACLQSELRARQAKWTYWHTAIYMNLQLVRLSSNTQSKKTKKKGKVRAAWNVCSVWITIHILTLLFAEQKQISRRLSSIDYSFVFRA